MDEFVRKAAGLGLPMVVLLIAMTATGLSGAAAMKCSNRRGELATNLH